MKKTTGECILSERQGKFLGFVACFGGGLLLACLIAVVVVILNKALDHFGGVFWSLAVSGMLAILLRPVVTLFEEKVKMGIIASILTLYLLTVFVVGSGFWLVGGKVIRQSKDFVGTAEDWPVQIEAKAKENLPPETWDALAEHFQNFKNYWHELLGKDKQSSLEGLDSAQLDTVQSLSQEHRMIVRGLDAEERIVFFDFEGEEQRAQYLERKKLEMKNRAVESIGGQGEKIAEKSAEVLKSAWSGLMGFFAKITYLAIIPIYLFYFLGSNRNLIDDLDNELNFLSESLRDDIVFLLREFVGILVAFFRGQLVIGLLMGVGYAIGFSLSGLKFGIALGLLFGLLNIVPYLGSIVGILTTLVVAYLQPAGIAESGQWNILIGCGVSFLLVQLLESYYLTPKIMGQQTGLHPVVVIVSIFFWGTALGGILGMIFGIPLTAFLIIAWRLLCRKYFNANLC
jgi:predicted PurR-regulated permease PerM